MVYGIVIYFKKDNVIKAAIREIGLATNRFMIDHAVRPHLTLALFESDNETEIIEHFKGINVCAVTVRLIGINTFVSLKNVVYLDCALTDELRFTQNKYTTIPCRKYYDFYLPDNFHPHITLSIYLTQEEFPVAIGIAEKYHFPKKLDSEAIALIRCDDYSDIVIKECFKDDQ